MESGNAYFAAGLSGALQRTLLRASSQASRTCIVLNHNLAADRHPDDILCHREQRYVTEQLTMSYNRKQIILERGEVSEGLAGKYVELYDFPDGHLEVRWKGQPLPYRVFSKDQRVSHTAIVENKRLGHALAFVKAQQDLKHETQW